MKIKKREEVEVMGTFAGYTGGMDILEEERDDFTQKILKLLNYSGMMNFEVVNMFGMELGLIKEVELDEKGIPQLSSSHLCTQIPFFYFLLQLENKNYPNGILKGLSGKTEELRVNPLIVLKFSTIVTRMGRNSEKYGSI